MTSRPDALVTPAVTDAAVLTRWQVVAAPLVTGALVAASWLNFSLFPVAWVAFVPLLWALGRASSRRESLRLGLLAGLATNIPAFYWLVYTIHVFGGFPYPLALFFYACLSLYSAMQFVLFAWGFHRLRFGPLGLFAPVLWVALELLFPNLFPWRMANSQLEMPLLMQSGDLAGPYLLSFVMVWVSAAIALALSARRRFAPLAAAVAAVAVLVLYGLWRMPDVQAAIDAAPTVRVGLVQGNIGVHEKGNVSLFDVNLDHYRELSAPLQSQVDLLIWPESVAQWWTEVGTDQVTPKHNPYVGTSTYLIYGGLAFEYPEEGGEALMYNSAFLINGDGRVFGRYDKQVLIPFGEYIPGGSLIPGMYDLSPQTSHFTPAPSSRRCRYPGSSGWRRSSATRTCPPVSPAP
jgi:apolipoprotein N-acyltransferase